jgi:hypothetical protein
MFSTGLFRPVACACLMALCAARASAGQAGDASLYRVFLRDGSTLVSYGEFARVGDRVVVSVPLGASGAAPDLQLVSLPADAVDWEKTDAYADSVRAAQYAETRGPNDFALLSEGVSRALNEIANTPDPQRKIAMAAEARQNVMTWASEHFGYRARSVAELAGLFDAVIAETRAAGGVPNYDLSLIANLAEAPSTPMLPPPTEQQSLDQALRAASLVADASERTSLLRSIQKVLGTIEDRPAWASAMRERVDAAVAVEERTDRAYAGLVQQTLAQAERYARQADVTGVEQVVRRVLREDDRLGQKRPNEMASALAALDAQLDEARRLRLARDSYAARAGVLRAYQQAIASPVAVMRSSRTALDAIRRLAGPSRLQVTQLSVRASTALQRLAAAAVPAEAATAHDLLKNAVTLAARAADGRLQAIASGSMQQAWEASSAAAGALMLFDRAADELKQLAANLPRPRAAS